MLSGSNVGVGTTSPASKLDVNGIIRATQLCDEAGANCNDLSLGIGGDPSYSSDSSSPDSSVFVTNDGHVSITSGNKLVLGANTSDMTNVVKIDHAIKSISFGHCNDANCSSGQNYLDVDYGNGKSIFYGMKILVGINGTEAAPAFSFNSDNDSGLFRPTTNTLGFATDASERMRIDSSGNVGIGTTSPAQKLDVVGNINSSGTITAATDLKIGANSVCQSNGTNCPAGAGATGTVTNIATGAGLTGGPITTTGTISVAGGGNWNHRTCRH